MNDITSYQGIVFVKNKPPGLIFCDLGYELSARMHDYIANKNTLPFLVEETLSELVSEFTFTSEDGRDYLAFENISILFEPELGVNVDMFFENASKRTCVIILSEHKASNLAYYPFLGNTEFKINLINRTIMQIGYELDNK